MGRFEKGWENGHLGGGGRCWEWGVVIRKDSADPKMIFTHSCPRGAGQQTPWGGGSCWLPSPGTRVPPVSVSEQQGGGWPFSALQQDKFL